MIEDFFETPPRLSAHAARTAETGPYPAALETVLSHDLAEAALSEIGSWPGYAPTPLHDLDRLAGELGLGALRYKDESGRFGLGSFKALGGAYAVLCLLADQLEASLGRPVALESIRASEHAAAASSVTVVTATDGNHGRSVAWGARQAGCRCRIYIHAEVSANRERAMEALGAEVVRIDGDYDESVRLCAEEAARNDWFVVSDTSYEGYMDLPRQVMAGYTVMAAEVLAATGDAPPTHVFVQAGVGGLAAALCARFWMDLGEDRPRFVVVESERAACLIESARQNRPTAVKVEEETMMAGLSCGEVSLLAWEILSRGAEHFVTLPEEGVAPAMRMLAAGAAGGGAIEAGECGVPGVVALMAACADPDLRAAMGLDGESRVLVLGCEGATDPEIYRAIIEAA